jgi:DnaK suppressor protein
MAKPDRKAPIDDAQARKLLKDERKRIEGALGDLVRVRESEVDEISDDTDPADAGGHIEEEQIDDALVRSLRGELEAVERAEKRLEDGGFGFSVESGKPIPRKRLEAVPWAERTAEEQKNYERVHGKPW